MCVCVLADVFVHVSVCVCKNVDAYLYMNAWYCELREYTCVCVCVCVCVCECLDRFIVFLSFFLGVR